MILSTEDTQLSIGNLANIYVSMNLKLYFW